MTDFIPAFARQALRHLSFPGYVLPSLFVVAGMLILSGCREEAAPAREALRPVRTVLVPPFSSGGLMTQTGEIRAHEEISLAFRLDGRVITRTTDIGQHVNAGQVLATLDSNAAQNQLSSATADLASARASEHVAALTLRRMQQLMPGGAISRSQLDSAKVTGRRPFPDVRAVKPRLKMPRIISTGRSLPRRAPVSLPPSMSSRVRW